MCILPTVLYTFPKVLMRRIFQIFQSFFFSEYLFHLKAISIKLVFLITDS